MTMRRLALAIIVMTCAAACTLKEEPGAKGNPQEFPAPKDVAAPPADALKTPSGLASKVIIVGLGSIHPTPRSTVTVHYTGWTADGKMFESTHNMPGPATFPVGGVIPGWQEALQLMVVGEKRRFWIPGHLAYDNSSNPADPKGQLCFEIQLVDIK